MILGACPPPEETSMEDHVRFLEQEHTAILREWKEHFGRLPPPLLSSSSRLSPVDTATANQGWDTTTTPAATTETAVGVNALPNNATPADMRQSLGIVENDGELWDSDGEEGDDDDSRNPAAEPSNGTTCRSPPRWSTSSAVVCRTPSGFLLVRHVCCNAHPDNVKTV